MQQVIKSTAFLLQSKSLLEAAACLEKPPLQVIQALTYLEFKNYTTDAQTQVRRMPLFASRQLCWLLLCVSVCLSVCLSLCVCVLLCLLVKGMTTRTWLG